MLGIRKGWEGLVHYNPEDPTTHSDHVTVLTRARVRDIDRTAGSYLHSSRIDPGRVSPSILPSFFGALCRSEEER